MKRLTTLNNFKSSRLYCTISSSFAGILVVIVCLLAFSILMTKFDAPEAMVSVMSSLALCIGAYSGGYIASRKRRQNGLILGLMTGILIYCLILAIGLLFAKTSVTLTFFSKLVMTIVCGAIGGIIGVNSKKKRY